MGVDIDDVLVGSVIMPPLIALLNQRTWPATVKGLVALVACLAAATLSGALSGKLSFGDWKTTALTVSASAFAAYRVWWQPSGIAPIIEAATSVR